MRPEERERPRVARVLDGDGVARVDEGARDQVEPLLGAVDDQESRRRRPGCPAAGGARRASRGAAGSRTGSRRRGGRRRAPPRRGASRRPRPGSPARPGRGGRGRGARAGAPSCAPAARRGSGARSDGGDPVPRREPGRPPGRPASDGATRVPPPLFVSIHPSRLRTCSAWWTVARFTSSVRARSREAGRRSPSWIPALPDVADDAVRDRPVERHAAVRLFRERVGEGGHRHRHKDGPWPRPRSTPFRNRRPTKSGPGTGRSLAAAGREVVPEPRSISSAKSRSNSRDPSTSFRRPREDPLPGLRLEGVVLRSHSRSA